MLNDKACAVALLEEFSKQNILKIESQFIKNDIIFYKFENSNISVSKKLNNLDFSTLTNLDFNFLLNVVDEHYIGQEDYINDSAAKYSGIIHGWSEEHSIISKMMKFSQYGPLNDLGMSNMVKKLNLNERILDLLLNNKARLAKQNSYSPYNNRATEGIEYALDVTVNKINTDDQFDTLSVTIRSTDENINLFNNLVGITDNGNITNDDNAVNKIAVTLGLLIDKYNLNNNDETYKNHHTTVYSMKGSYRNTITNINNFVESYKSLLTGILTTSMNMVTSILSSGNYYSNRYDLGRLITNNIVNLNMDYASMTDAHLNLFKTNVEWLINRHAKYITNAEKEKESYILFLGSNQLDGKKKTKEILTSHLNLGNMYTEIERRGRL